MHDDVYRAVERIIAGARYGQRGGPRSRLVDAIMVLLLSRPMRSSEIGEVLGLESKYISSYLSYWKARGYVDYEAGLWHLTPLGEEYAREVLARVNSDDFDKFASIARRLVGSQVKSTINDKNRGKRRGQARKSLQFTVGNKVIEDNKRQERSRAAACVLSALQSHLSSEELDIMELILNHYVEWGSTYTYVDQLAEAIKADLTWLMRILRGLQSKGLIYIYTDPRLGVRIGLSRRVKEELKPC